MHPDHLQSKYIDLTHTVGLICISGQDAAKLLQGQVTCDVTEINATTSRLGAFCNVKGRIQASFRLFIYQSAYYLIVPYTMCNAVVEDLNRYAVFYKVQIEIVSEKWHITGLVGPLVSTYLSSLNIECPAKDGVVSQEDTIFIALPGGANTRLLCLSLTTPIIPEHFTQSPTTMWSLLDIQAGISSIYPQTKGLFTPHQLNYPSLGGVSFKKGCYTGQEIIARMEHLGQRKNQLMEISFSLGNLDNTGLTKDLPGTPIHDEHAQTQGTLVMAAPLDSSHVKYSGLAYLQKSGVSGVLYLKNNPIRIITCFS